LPAPTGYGEKMITVLFDVTDDTCLDAARTAERLAVSLASLIPAVIEGLVSDAIIRDTAQNTAICDVADQAGAKLLSASPAEAIAVARGSWLLLLEPGARLEPGWAGPARRFIESGVGNTAHLSLAGQGLLARLFARPRALRRGLLISRPAAVAIAGTAQSLEALARGRAGRRIRAALVPSEDSPD
jgi:hypothetical protein